MKNKEFKDNDEKLNYYLNLPYTRTFEFIDDESGKYYYGKIQELDGCHSDGETLEELEENLQDALLSWLDVAITYGDPIPEPVKPEGYSGKVTLRMPKTLHAKLVRDADTEGISLNQYVLYKLSQ